MKEYSLVRTLPSSPRAVLDVLCGYNFDFQKTVIQKFGTTNVKQAPWENLSNEEEGVELKRSVLTFSTPLAIPDAVTAVLGKSTLDMQEETIVRTSPNSDVLHMERYTSFVGVPMAKHYKIESHWSVQRVPIGCRVRVQGKVSFTRWIPGIQKLIENIMMDECVGALKLLFDLLADFHQKGGLPSAEPPESSKMRSPAQKAAKMLRRVTASVAASPAVPRNMIARVHLLLALILIAFSMNLGVDFFGTELSVETRLTLTLCANSAVLISVPLSNGIANLNQNRNFFTTPFIGGPRYVALQGLGWFVYATFVVGCLSCTYFLINDGAIPGGFHSYAGLMGLFSELLVLASLPYYSNNKENKEEQAYHVSEWHGVGYLGICLVVTAFTLSVVLEMADSFDVLQLSYGVSMTVGGTATLLVLVAVPLTHCLAGKHKDRKFAVWQPGVGGSVFLFLQTLGWGLYAFFIIASGLLLHFNGANWQGFIVFTALCGVMSQGLIFYSLRFFDSSLSLYFMCSLSRQRLHRAHMRKCPSIFEVHERGFNTGNRLQSSDSRDSPVISPFVSRDLDRDLDRGSDRQSGGGSSFARVPVLASEDSAHSPYKNIDRSISEDGVRGGQGVIQGQKRAASSASLSLKSFISPPSTPKGRNGRSLLQFGRPRPQSATRPVRDKPSPHTLMRRKNRRSWMVEHNSSSDDSGDASPSPQSGAYLGATKRRRAKTEKPRRTARKQTTIGTPMPRRTLAFAPL